MKTILAFFLLTSTLAHAALQSGSYYGNDNSSKNFELHVRELPERKGSFIAILINDDSTKARAYLVDSFTDNKYGLNSLQLRDNYNIGVANITPTLGITFTNDRLILAANNGQDDMGFNSSITFKAGSMKPLKWSSLIPGEYGVNFEKTSVSNLDAYGESSLTSKAPGLVGDFTLRETRHDMYVLLSSKLTPTGVKLDKNTDTFVVFLKKESFFSKNRMLVINSDTGATRVLKK